MAETLPFDRVSSLPRPRTRLLGREMERATMRAALLYEGVALLTLIGPGGVGKTRLALAIALDVAQDFADGVVWVDLAPLTNSTRVPAAVLGALDVTVESSKPATEELIHLLRRRQTLLLLDNCEHVVAAVAELAARLLDACPALQILATSRASLHVRGERTLVVEPLPLPLSTTESPENLMRNASVALFVERARAVRPAFVLTETNAPSVAALCQRLEGLPLAIELAAARSRILSPEALLAQMTDRLRLLSGGPRDLPVRQQAIEATIGWSYALLDPDTRRLFRRLAVFSGGCDLAAIASVAGGDQFHVFKGLTALCDQGLLRPVEGVGGADRYAMLETVREYALARLAESEEEEIVRDAHAAYFLALAETAEPGLRGAEQATWLRRLEADYSNILSALSSFCKREEGELARRLAGALWPFWQLRGRFEEARQRLQEVLALPGPARTAARAKAQAALGYMVLQGHQSELPRARALLEEALAVWREIGDQSGIALALGELMAVALNEGDVDQARALGEGALEIFRALDDDYGIWNALWILGVVSYRERSYARAHDELEEALRLASAMGTPSRLSILRCLGWLAIAEGDARRAAALWEERLAAYRNVGHEPGVGGTLDDLGWLARQQRDWSQAVRYFAEELALGTNLDEDWNTVRSLVGLAIVSADTGQLERAAWLFGAAELTTSLGHALDEDFFNPIRIPYEHAVATTRNALGDAGFAAAWRAGHELPRPQAVMRALADLALSGAAAD
jgi:predicted ATPase